MSKQITIPTDKGSRVHVTINQTNYVYKAGDTVTVPDEVAALFEDNAYSNLEPRRGVSPMNSLKYADGVTGVPIATDEYGNLYGDPVASVGAIYVEGHKVIVPSEE